MCEWFPDVDEYDALSIPGYPENPILLDFAIWGDVTGLDYPDDWEFPGDIRWDPPTAWELAYTNWSCEHWDMEISWGVHTCLHRRLAHGERLSLSGTLRRDGRLCQR